MPLFNFKPFFGFRNRLGHRRFASGRVEFETPVLPGGRLPLRSGFTPHEVLLHFGLFVGSLITLCGGHPALATHVQSSHPIFLTTLSIIIVLGCGSVVAGVIIRRMTGTLYALLIELLGIIIVSGAETAYALFSFASSPAHNYTSYLFLASFALANIWRARQIKVDTEEARKVAPR